MKTLKLLSLYACVSLCLAACKKDGDAVSKQSGDLTSAPWKAIRVEWRETESGKWVPHPFLTSLPTEKVTFFDDGTYASSSGASSSSGAWKLSADNASLTLIKNTGASSTLAVEALTSSTLKLSVPLHNEYVIGKDPNTKETTYTYFDTEMETFGH